MITHTHLHGLYNDGGDPFPDAFITYHYVKYKAHKTISTSTAPRQSCLDKSMLAAGKCVRIRTFYAMRYRAEHLEICSVLAKYYAYSEGNAPSFVFFHEGNTYLITLGLVSQRFYRWNKEEKKLEQIRKYGIFT